MSGNGIFSQDELLQALRQASAPDETSNGDPGGMTTLELADALGVSDKTVLKRLRILIAKGLVEHVQVPRKKITGMDYRADAYRLKATGEGD